MMDSTNVKKRMDVRILVLVVMVALIGMTTACSGGTSSEPAISDTGGTEAGSGGSSCLGEYTDKICELLTEEMVRAQFPEMPEEFKTSTRTTGFNMCNYNWMGSRKGSREVGGMVIEYELKDVVSIQFLKVLKQEDPLAFFHNSYRTLTPEEKEKQAESFREQMDKQAKKAELSEEGQEMGEALGTGILNSQKYESVDGVGTAAAWGGMAGQKSLQVLHHDTKFELLVDVYEEEARNLEAAVALARKILAFCD